MVFTVLIAKTEGFWGIPVPVSHFHQISHMKLPGIESKPPRLNDVLNSDLAIGQILVINEVKRRLLDTVHTKSYWSPQIQFLSCPRALYQRPFKTLRPEIKYLDRLSWESLLFLSHFSSVTGCFVSLRSLFTCIDFVRSAKLSSFNTRLNSLGLTEFKVQ
jgi:hypothetical protein